MSPARLRAARGAASSPTTSRRSSTRRARRASPRARCSRTGTSSPTSSTGCEVDPVHRRRHRALVPAALARLRADGRLRLPLQDGVDRVRRVDRQARGELPEVNPHCFGAVPRLYEKVYAKILAKADAGSPIKKKIFAWALAVGRERLPYVTEAAPAAGRARPEGEDRRRARLQEDPRGPRRRLPLRRLRRRAARDGPRRVLLRRRCRDLRGLRPDGDLARHLA